MNEVVDSSQDGISGITSYEASEDRGIISIRHHTYLKHGGTLCAKQEFGNNSFAPFLSVDTDTAIIWESPFHPQQQRFIGTTDLFLDNKKYHVNMFERQLFIFEEGIASIVPKPYYSYYDGDFNLIYIFTPAPEFALSYHIIDDSILFEEREIRLICKRSLPQKIKKVFNHYRRIFNEDSFFQEDIEDILPV